MQLEELVQNIKPYLIPIGLALVFGKAIRRVLLLPVEWLVRKTNNKIDDVILKEAESDLGLDDSTLNKASRPTLDKAEDK